MLKNIFNRIRTELKMPVPTGEIIIKTIPSDLSKISLLSQLLAHADNIIVRMNFKNESFSILSFDDDWTVEAELILSRHNIQFNTDSPDSSTHNSAVILRSTPQFQYTNLSSPAKINQEMMTEMRDEFITNATIYMAEQLGQSHAKPDFMIRVRRIDDSELIDLKENLHRRIHLFRKDLDSQNMQQVDGLVFDQRTTTSELHFGSFGPYTLLQNQEEDILNNQLVFVYEVIIFVDEIDVHEIESILKMLPNAITACDLNIDSEKRMLQYISTGQLMDGTYPIGSVATIAKMIELNGGNLVLKKQSVEFTVPPRHIFAHNDETESKYDVVIGNVETTSYNAILKMKPEHTLIVGATNTGKTNGSFMITDALINAGVSVFVIEPTKGEWKNLAGLYDFSAHGIEIESQHKVISLSNPESGVSLLFNPFTVPGNVSVDSHIQGIINSFSIAFGNDLSTPQASVLVDVLYSLYENYENPTFSEFLNLISEHEDPMQPGQAFEWLKQALIRKLKPFTKGSIGHCFDVKDGLTPQDLLNTNIIVNLSWIKDEQMKNFVTAVLLSSCFEWLEINGTQSGKLKHQIIIEEAHRLFPNIPISKMNSKENSSVKVVSQLLKEVRAYDTGVMLIDQSPSALYDDAILNTAKKISFRVASGKDKKILMDSMMLDEDQVQIMTVLEPGRSFILDPNTFSYPYMVQFDRMDEIYHRRLEACGVIDPKTIDDNVRNLMGKTILDERLNKVAKDYYRSIGIEWEPYGGVELCVTSAPEIKNRFDEIIKNDCVDKKEMIINSNIQNPMTSVGDVVRYMDEHDIGRGYDKGVLIHEILKHLRRVSCGDKFLCASAMVKTLKKSEDTPQDWSSETIGDLFLKLIEWGVLEYDSNSRMIKVKEEFVLHDPEKRPDFNTETNIVDSHNSESEIELDLDLSFLDLENVTVDGKRSIAGLTVINGTKNGKSVLIFYISDNDLTSIFNKILTISMAYVGTKKILIVGLKDVLEQVGTEMNNLIAIGNNDIETMDLLSRIEVTEIKI